MKLCSIIIDSLPSIGVKTDDGIVDITALGFPALMNDVIEGGDDMLSKISSALQGKTHPLLNEENIQFLPHNVLHSYLTKRSPLFIMGFSVDC